ncbi:transglutaminase domain-containing protein, partial [Acinetobacter baumannii]
STDPEARLLAALRFVQREVRYLGIEMGANSHAPHPPETVLPRRYGDCKDKTLLTLTLLGRLGIPASPALVHTTERQAAAERLPTPWAF